MIFYTLQYARSQYSSLQTIQTVIYGPWFNFHFPDNMFDDIHTVQTKGIANVRIDVNSDKCIFLDTKSYQHMVIKAATKRKLTNPGVYIILYIFLVIKLKDECNKYVNEICNILSNFLVHRVILSIYVKTKSLDDNHMRTK